MIYENEKIDASVVHHVAEAYRAKLLEDIKEREKDVRENVSLSPAQKERKYTEIRAMQSKRVANSSILNADKIIGEIDKELANVEELKVLEGYLAKTGNARALATLKGKINKDQREIWSKDTEATKLISSMQNPSFDTMGLHVEDLGEGGFRIENDISLVDNISKDSYSKLFSIALNNVTTPKTMDIKLQDEREEQQDSPEMADFTAVRELFESDVLNEYVGELKKASPKIAQKFEKTKKKKLKAVGKAEQVAKTLDGIRGKEKDIRTALTELNARSANLPRDVFDSIKVDLEKQLESLNKEEFKADKKKTKIISKSGLEASIQSGKAYHEAQFALSNNEGNIRAENEMAILADDLTKTYDDSRAGMEYRMEELKNITASNRRKEDELKRRIGGIVAFEVLNSTAKTNSNMALPAKADIGEQIANEGNKMNHLLAAIKSQAEVIAYDENEREEPIKENGDIERE